jgi:hypothetical protein
MTVSQCRSFSKTCDVDYALHCETARRKERTNGERRGGLVSYTEVCETAANQKAEKGVSPYQLQEWLGHANLNTTQVYVHLAKQSGGKVMEQTSRNRATKNAFMYVYMIRANGQLKSGLLRP